MIAGIHHVHVTIPEGQEQRAREFYCGVLELPEIEKPDTLKGRGGIWLQAGDRQVHIGTEDGVDRTGTKAHIAYQVADLTVWRTRLQEAGFKIIHGIPIPGHDRFEFRDPFGNRVEMIQPLNRMEAES